jgi:FkbM family methyltransferase
MNLDIVKNYFIPSRILDIGANVGGWYAQCKQIFPESYIFSIEANEECETILKNVNPNYFIKLLTRENKIYPFYTSNVISGTGNSIYKELTPYFNEQNTKVLQKQGYLLDEVFDENEKFDLIKMDVQGAELDIIRGGIKLCKKAKGILLEVALKEYNQNSPLYDEVVDYMKSINFTKYEILSDLPYNGEIYHQDILFINENIIHN